MAQLCVFLVLLSCLCLFFARGWPGLGVGEKKKNRTYTKSNREKKTEAAPRPKPRFSFAGTAWTVAALFNGL
jgi:hypothetical protein